MSQRRPIRCPRCGRPAPWEGNEERPFCSRRCRLADLGNWAAERYRIAADPVGESDGEGERDPDESGF